MERIHYAGSSVLTGTAIARSLLRYAEALALEKGSMTVEIPVRQPSGALGHAALLIGPASQLFSETEESEADEIVDEALVERFTTEAARLGVSHPVAEAAADVDGPSLDGSEILPFSGEEETW